MRAIETTIVIERPVESAFDYVVKPASWPTWSSMVIAVRTVEARPLHANARFTVTAKLLGRQFDSDEAVTDFEPGKLLAYTTVTGSMPATWTWRFQEVPEGTRLVQIAVGDDDRAGRFFRIAWPIIERVFRRQIAAVLARSRTCWRRRPEAGTPVRTVPSRASAPRRPGRGTGRRAPSNLSPRSTRDESAMVQT